MYQKDLETLEREGLERLKLEGLRRTLKIIEEGNRHLFEKLGKVRADDINSLSDLTRLPFMTKDDLRDAYPFKFVCVPPSRIVRLQMSSGTTGAPVVCPYTEGDVKMWGEVMARCLATAGVTRDDVIQITPSFGLPNGGFGFHYGAEALGAMIVPTGPGRTSYQLRLMADMGTTVLGAIASYPLRLMEVAREEGFDFKKTRLRVGVFGSEPWSDEMRRKIEEGMGIETFDIIGMTETGGVGMGIDCPSHQGIHVWEDHYIVEVIDPNSGEVLPDGREGELVVTTIKREALPVIRYRTRDITAIISRNMCECGRTHLRLSRFKGRTDDMIIYKGAKFYPSQVEAMVFKERGVAHDYQIILERDSAGVEHIKLLVETTESLGRGVKEKLEEKIYNQLGLHIPLEFIPAGTLPREPGKAVRVVDRR